MENKNKWTYDYIDQKEYINLWERFENLSQDNKRKAVNEILGIIKKYLGIQEQENNEKICSEIGHTFGGWRKRTYTSKEPGDDSPSPIYVDVKHIEWKRKCERCGLLEKVYCEPQELANKRKEKVKKLV